MTLQNRIFTLGLVLAVGAGAMSFAQAQESEPSPATKQRTIAELDKALREVERAHKEMAELRAKLQLARVTGELKTKYPRRVPPAIVSTRDDVLVWKTAARKDPSNNLNTAARSALLAQIVADRASAKHRAVAFKAEYLALRKAAGTTKAATGEVRGNATLQREMLATMHVLLREVRELRTLVESLRPQPNTNGR